MFYGCLTPFQLKTFLAVAPHVAPIRARMCVRSSKTFKITRVAKPLAQWYTFLSPNLAPRIRTLVTHRKGIIGLLDGVLVWVRNLRLALYLGLSVIFVFLIC